MKSIIDSSIWLEYFLGGSLPQVCLKTINDTENLLVPSVVLYEVFKKFLKQYNETEALRVIEEICGGKVIEMDYHLSIFAAKIAKDCSLGMADSFIYATALLYEADLWTMDSDFKGLPNVNYFAKKVV